MDRRIMIPLFSVLIILIGQPPAYAGKFIFNPPEGITFKETASMNRTKDMGELGKQVDRTEQIMDARMQKTATGYSLKSTLRDMTFTRNGQVVTEPFFEAMLGMTMEYQLDAQGHIQDITGLGSVIDKMLANIPEMPPSVKELLSEDAMKKKSVVEYNGRIGDFIGKEYEIGDVWTSESQFTLPDGTTIDYLTMIRFRDTEPCGKTQCVRVEYVYDADPAVLKNFVADIFEDLDEGAKMYLTNMSTSAVKISGSGKRLIDPQTMLIYDEELKRTIVMPMNIPGRGEIPMVMTEERLYEFEYNE